jgi:hypothetical protein
MDDALKGPQERFLGQVASFFTIFRQAIEQTVNLTRAFIHQFFKGASVASLQSFNELSFILWPYISHGRRSNLL